MRRTLPVVVVVLLALSAPAARADLSFANPAVSVGEVRSGTPLRQRFAFVNDGPGHVEILDLQPSCGCVRPKLDKRSYAPGERGELMLEVHTLSQPAGENVWRLRVSYRAAGEPRTADLIVRGRIVAEVMVRPAVLTIFTEAVAAHEIRLTDLRSRPLIVTGVSTSAPFLKGEFKGWVTVAGLAVVGQEAIIGLSLGADCPDGRHEETVTISTDDPEYRELTVPVTVIKRPKQKVTASPSSVSLVTPHGQPVPSRIVLLRPAGAGAVVVDRVEADDPAVVCTWAQGPNDCATLKVGIDRGRMPADGLRSAIHAHISKPISEIITIPIMCRAE
jgi:hypothetical protein